MSPGRGNHELSDNPQKAYKLLPATPAVTYRLTGSKALSAGSGALFSYIPNFRPNERLRARVAELKGEKH